MEFQFLKQFSPLPALLRYNWNMRNVDLKYISDDLTYLYCEMITTIGLVNKPISSHSSLVCVWLAHQLVTYFGIEKGVQQGCLLSPCLFDLRAEHTMRNAGLDELQAGIKTGGRNINSVRNADETILKAESKEELKSLLMRVKGESERKD